MKTGIENIQNELVSKAEYDQLLLKYQTLKAQLSELQRMIFGSKSERFIPVTDGQIDLFTGTSLSEQAKEQKQEISYTRTVGTKKKQKPIRTEIPSHLPRIEEIIEPTEIEPGSGAKFLDATSQNHLRPWNRNCEQKLESATCARYRA